MKKTFLISSFLIGTASLASAATFYAPSAVSAPNSVAYFAVNNVIQGSGVGYDASAPHDALAGGGGTFLWVTNNPNGGGDYYDNAVPAPIVIFDLGVDVLLGEISTWGYATGNTNGAKDYSLAFATDAEGTGAFGTSITYNPTFEAAFDNVTRDSEAFAQNVTARYVEMTITDNWRGFQGVTPGGDRVGLAEVAFEVVPEPSAALLGLLSSALLLRRRR